MLKTLRLITLFTIAALSVVAVAPLVAVDPVDPSGTLVWVALVVVEAAVPANTLTALTPAALATVV